MGKKKIVCRCGGSFDENGICTQCGKKRQRSAGYRVFHGILIVIASLFLLLCLSMTLSVRHYVRYHNISGGLKNARLSDFVIPGTGGQTVTEYIQKEFVTDDRVLPEDIAGAVDATNITGYLAEKADQMGKMLRGESDNYPTFSADEVVKLLEESEATLYSKCMLVIEEKDKENLRQQLEEPFEKLNSAAEFLYGSKAGRALARFRISIARVIVDLVLLGLLLWRWIKVRRNSGKSGYGAVRGMGWVFFVPSALVLIFCIVTSLQMAFKSDDIVSIYTMIKGIRTPHWLLSPLTTAFGILLMAIAGYVRGLILHPKRKAQPESASAPEERAAIPAKRPEPAPTAPAAKPETTETAAEPAAAAQTVTRTAPAAPVQTTQTAAVPAANRKACTHCGKEIKQDATFCMYCGTKQIVKPPVTEPAQVEEIAADDAPQDVPEFAAEVQDVYGADAPAEIPAQNDSPMRSGLESYLKKMESQNGDSAE